MLSVVVLNVVAPFSGQFYKTFLALFTLLLTYCLRFWLRSVNYAEKSFVKIATGVCIRNNLSGGAQ
jgi:hypothetical protein